MRVTHYRNDFYAFYHTPDSVAAYIRRSIPNVRRHFSSEPEPCWVVHRDYVASAIKLAEAAKVHTTCEFSDVIPDLEITQYVTKVFTLSVDEAYRTLHLLPTAPPVMIAGAWKILAKYYHPDSSTGDTATFLKIKQAHEVLKNAGLNGGVVPQTPSTGGGT